MFQHDLSKGKGIVIIGGARRMNRAGSIDLGFELMDGQSDFFRIRKY